MMFTSVAYGTRPPLDAGNYYNLLYRRETLSSGKFVVATIMQHRHPFADEIRALPGVEVIEVTTQNRDVLPGRIREMIAMGGAAHHQPIQAGDSR